MFLYNILQKPDIDLNKKIIDNIFERIFNIVKKTQKGTLNIVFVDSESIKNLNNNYRKINKVTDVLSFHYFDNFSNLKDEDIAGEIILNYDKILEQSKDFALSPEQEFYKLLIHSLLHILGYDHEEDNDYKIMSEFEKRIYQEVFEK